MYDYQDDDSQRGDDELATEVKSLRRQVRNLESIIQRNKAMLAARVNIGALLETEQKKMERNMMLLLENSADIILLFDRDGRFSYFTNTFLTATGLADGAFISGRHFAEVFDQLARPNGSALFRPSLTLRWRSAAS